MKEVKRENPLPGMRAGLSKQQGKNTPRVQRRIGRVGGDA